MVELTRAGVCLHVIGMRVEGKPWTNAPDWGFRIVRERAHTQDERKRVWEVNFENGAVAMNLFPSSSDIARMRTEEQEVDALFMEGRTVRAGTVLVAFEENLMLVLFVGALG